MTGIYYPLLFRSCESESKDWNMQPLLFWMITIWN